MTEQSYNTLNFRVLPSEKTSIGIVIPLRTNLYYPKNRVVNIFYMPHQKLLSEFGETKRWLYTAYDIVLEDLCHSLIELNSETLFIREGAIFSKIKADFFSSIETLVKFVQEISCVAMNYPATSGRGIRIKKE